MSKFISVLLLKCHQIVNLLYHKRVGKSRVVWQMTAYCDVGGINNARRIYVGTAGDALAINEKDPSLNPHWGLWQ